MLDRIMAAVARRTGAILLTCDGDLARLADVVEIEVDSASAVP